KKRQLFLERLEDRTLPSISPSGIAVWQEEGPRPIINGQLLNVPPNNPEAGAINSIAIDSNHPGTIWIATVNGGVWRTTNADPNHPAAISWQPMTDQMPSLAIASVAIDPLDSSGNTIWAGTGNWTSGPGGGAAVGVYRTTNGGQNWALLG